MPALEAPPESSNHSIAERFLVFALGMAVLVGIGIGAVVVTLLTRQSRRPRRSQPNPPSDSEEFGNATPIIDRAHLTLPPGI